MKKTAMERLKEFHNNQVGLNRANDAIGPDGLFETWRRINGGEILTVAEEHAVVRTMFRRLVAGRRVHPVVAGYLLPLLGRHDWPEHENCLDDQPWENSLERSAKALGRDSHKRVAQALARRRPRGRRPGSKTAVPPDRKKSPEEEALDREFEAYFREHGSPTLLEAIERGKNTPSYPSRDLMLQMAVIDYVQTDEMGIGLNLPKTPYGHARQALNIDTTTLARHAKGKLRHIAEIARAEAAGDRARGQEIRDEHESPLFERWAADLLEFLRTECLHVK